MRFSLALWACTPAFAQESGPQPPVDRTAPAAESEQTSDDRVVVTGSLIAGSPEDAALPVEVYSQADLEEQGSPTALEFAKSLTIAGFTQGEANFQGGSAPGAVSFNLRGIGAEKSLTLLNGRRVSENVSFIPGAALARTELLKDGAAVTYGADAVGGVINFITRSDFVGSKAKHPTSTSTARMATTPPACSAVSAKTTSTSSGRLSTSTARR